MEQSPGQPTKYKPEFAKQAAKACSLGASDKDLADLFFVTETTINNWKQEHPKFFESINSAKADFDNAVERSLLQRALGYSHPDVDIRTRALGDNQGSEIVETPIIKHYPPSEVACIFWLKNRQPKRWRDKMDVELDASTDLKEMARLAARSIVSGDAIIPTTT